MRFPKKIFTALMLAVGLTGFAPGLVTKASADDPYLGDIMMFGGNFCPRGWAATDGQLLAINDNQALFSLMGTTFGGDGRTSFGLPDLRGRTGIGQGQGPGLTNRFMGQKLGSESVILQVQNLPPHRHLVNANNEDGDRAGPGNKLLAAAPPSGVGSETIYSTLPPNRDMASDMLEATGSATPFGIQIRDPFTVMTRCIALTGNFPPRP